MFAFFLCTVPKILLQKNGCAVNIVDAFVHIISAFAVQPTQCRITSSQLHFTEDFVVPLKCFSEKECAMLRDNSAKLAEWQFKSLYRALLMRDFVNICFLQQHKIRNRKQWPLFALMAVQRLIFVQEYRTRFLFDAERSLQGYGEMPILNRSGSSKE